MKRRGHRKRKRQEKRRCLRREGVTTALKAWLEPLLLSPKLRTKIIKSGLALCLWLVWNLLQEKQALICWSWQECRDHEYELTATRCRVFDCKMLGLYLQVLFVDDKTIIKPMKRKVYHICDFWSSPLLEMVMVLINSRTMGIYGHYANKSVIIMLRIERE